MREEIPPVVHPPTPAIDASNKERKAWHRAVAQADQEHTEKWKDGGPILINTVPEWDLIEYILGALSASKLDSFVIIHHNMSKDIASVPNSEFILMEIQRICDRANKDNGILTKLRPKSDRDTSPSGRRRADKSDRNYRDRRGANYRDSGKHNDYHSSIQFRTKAHVKCKNCGGNHITPKCTDPKCHDCGKILKSPEERQKHWYEIHRTAGTNRSTSSRDLKKTECDSNRSSKDGNFRKLRGKQRSSKRSRGGSNRSDRSDRSSAAGSGYSDNESSRRGDDDTTASRACTSERTGAGDSYSEDEYSES